MKKPLICTPTEVSLQGEETGNTFKVSVDSRTMRVKVTQSKLSRPRQLARVVYEEPEHEIGQVLISIRGRANDSGDFERAWTVLEGALGDEYR